MSNTQKTYAGKIVLWGVKTNHDVRPIRQTTVQYLINSLNFPVDTVDYYTTVPVMEKLIYDGLAVPQINTYSMASAREFLNAVEQSDTACIMIDYQQIISYIINDPACRSLEDFMLQLKNILLKNQKLAIITAYVSSDFDGSKLPDWMLKLQPFALDINFDAKLLHCSRK